MSAPTNIAVSVFIEDTKNDRVESEEGVERQKAEEAHACATRDVGIRAYCLRGLARIHSSTSTRNKSNVQQMPRNTNHPIVLRYVSKPDSCTQRSRNKGKHRDQVSWFTFVRVKAPLNRAMRGVPAGGRHHWRPRVDAMHNRLATTKRPLRA